MNSSTANPVSPLRPAQLGPLLAAVSLLAGCGSAPQPTTAWRVEPALRVAAEQPLPAPDASATLARARELEQQGQTRQALRAYRQAVQLAPQEAAMHHALGIALVRQGLIREAIAALQQAVALAPEQPRPLNNLGYARIMNGEHEQARALFQRALALAPDNQRARRNLDWLDTPAAQEQLAGLRVHGQPEPAPASTAVLVVQTRPDLPELVLGPAVPAQTVADSAEPISAAPSAHPVPAPAPAMAPALAAAITTTTTPIRVEIVNGNGISGAAARLGRWLQERGVRVDRTSNHKAFTTTVTEVQYSDDQLEEAIALARQLPMNHRLVEVKTQSWRRIRVLLGQDLSPAGLTETADALAKAQRSTPVAPTSLPTSPGLCAPTCALTDS